MKFMGIVTSGRLVFPAASTMKDTYEGQLGPFNLNDPVWRRADNPLGRPLTPEVRRHIKEMPRFTFLSCWHRSDVESAAMWDLYTSEGKGIAIACRWGELIDVLHPDIPVSGMTVVYKDYNQMPVPEHHVRLIYGYKRSSFRHEEEVRLVVQDESIAPPSKRLPRMGIFPLGIGYLAPPPIPEQFRPRPGGVLSAPLDLHRIDMQVKVSPDADAWWVDVIRNLLDRHDLRWPVSQSTLYTLS